MVVGGLFMWIALVWGKMVPWGLFWSNYGLSNIMEHIMCLCLRL